MSKRTTKSRLKKQKARPSFKNQGKHSLFNPLKVQKYMEFDLDEQTLRKVEVHAKESGLSAFEMSAALLRERIWKPSKNRPRTT